MAAYPTGRGLSRRTLLVGGGVGIGLALAWGLWPRTYPPNLRAAPGETILNAFLKIGRDGRVIVAVPQAELGQGVYTSLPQILADELGADWRTVSVEPAPPSPLYANQLLAEDFAASALPSALQSVGRWAAHEYATRTALMLTGGSSSVRAFEPRLREAGAAARALLSMAAAARWNVDWRRLDSVGGFVINGGERLRFGELAEAAAGRALPDDIPLRTGTANRLAGKPLPRLDLPAKVDGSAQYAGDVRLPDMVFASVRQGPVGSDNRLARIDRDAAARVPGVLAMFENARWAGAAASNWWAANRAAEALRPGFESRGGRASDAGIAAAFDRAGRAAATRFHSVGDIDAAMRASDVVRADYTVAPAASAALETLTATARITGDRLEIWAATQAPGYARAAAARAAGLPEGQVTLYPMLAGGGYGRRLETAAIEQAAIMTIKLKRPVQLTWSRLEETFQDAVRPPARATLAARLDGATIGGWQARIAAPATTGDVLARLRGDRPSLAAEAAAVAGAIPPYAIAAMAIDHVPAGVPLRTGLGRGAAHVANAFFAECFVDELARASGVEPLSFRMGMLGGNPRLARCLSTVAGLGGWDGGASGSAMGIAAHSAWGSHVAVLAEIRLAAGTIGVRRIACALDCGRVVNPAIVRQLIEGGIVHGIAQATMAPSSFAGGIASVTRLRAHGLPILKDMPEITIEIVASDNPPGGVTELGVPAVAPAIANAVFAASGQRLRALPLRLA